MKTTPRNPKPLKAAFTLLELLIVMLIIALLAGIIFAVGPAIMRTARKQSIVNDIQQLKIAIIEYNNEYGKYPVDPAMQGTDIFIGGEDGISTAELMNVLLAVPEGWNAEHRLNPKRTAFINPRTASGTPEHPRNGLAEDGKIYDMWGREYRILLDTNYDDMLDLIDDGFNYDDRDLRDDEGKIRGVGGVMIQTFGEDGEPAKKDAPDKNYKGSDDICSWL